MYDWKERIDSNVSQTYVYPLFPQEGDTVTLSIQISKEVKKVFVFLRMNGSYSRLNCTIEGNFANTHFIIKGATVSYYFAILAENNQYYYGLDGLSVAHPSQRNMFTIKANIDSAHWVNSATCYQIFPDRFKNGNPAIGHQEGQYDFDGGTVTKRAFDQKPLSYEKGKCLDFYDGDLQGIIDAIPHFKALGITCLYVNPIGVSRTTHRYDCCDFFHIDPNLGGDDMLIKLIDTLHAHAIKLIVDISLNHTGSDHPWYQKAKRAHKEKEASYYYTDETGKTVYWEGVPSLPQLNYNSEELRQIIYKGTSSVVTKFLQHPFHQDGWRFDVADVMGRYNEDQFCSEIWQGVRTAIKGVNKDAYIVGECWFDATEYLQGDMWDGTMNYAGCAWPLRRWMGESDTFLSGNWGLNPQRTRQYSGNDLKKAMEEQLKSTPSQMNFTQMNLIDSHDVSRLHNNASIMNKDCYKGIILLQYMLPGMPCTYYGDEIQLKGTTKTVEEARYPMNWNQHTWDMDMYHYFCQVGAMRKKYQYLLDRGSYAFLSSSENIMVFARYTASESLILVLNKGPAKAYAFRTCQLNGNTLEVIQGEGCAKLVPQAIQVNLEDKKSLLLHLM